MNLRPVAAELFHVERQTDMANVTVALRNFENASKKHSGRFLQCHQENVNVQCPACLLDVTNVCETKETISESFC